MTDRTGSINRFGGEGRYHWTGGLGQGTEREPGTEGQRDIDHSQVPVHIRKACMYFVSFPWMLEVTLPLT